MAKKLIINESECIGCGTCAALAPKTFIMNDNTFKAEVISSSGDTPETIKETLDACPVTAIKWSEE